jgi:hypothetical protein
MGTSSRYKMPTGGNWTPLKNEATDFVQGTGGEDVTQANLVTDFIRTIGGFKGLSRGMGGSAPAGHGSSGSGSGAKSGGSKGGGGGGGRSVSAAVGTARNFGSFLSRVQEAGLEEALKERGLEKLVGKPASEVADALLDEIAGPGSTLDNALAREALADLRDELLKDAQTFEDVKKALEESLDNLGLFAILADFFGLYVFKMFCRNFYEDWVKKVGNSRAAQTLKDMKNYIVSSLRAKFAGRKLDGADWKGKEGSQIAEQVLKETIEVFGVTG